ncbi:MAG: xanthine dehydrogenase family protein molybdopterin-binding subunit [Gammaproteobacteria bacterium]|nr:xanthine dehydrogenase family protein molybdopterin-binding subunit [Gammaproteobacteria bacterium]MDH4253595.1 xanthine dehydrogenase family protein molybdopterin-binding subunit [Gammaproteobacteria bacterium]
MAFKLIGENFIPPDLHGKVTGKAKYAEDFRVEGMVFCKMLGSPMPNARVVRIDASEALAMEGVVGILTADDVPEMPSPQQPILTNRPTYVGEPILAIAAVDETTAADALDRIRLELEPLPFVIDPLDSLKPSGPNARDDGNVANMGIPLQELKWGSTDFSELADGRLPMDGQPVLDWTYGDIERGFADAAIVYDETFVTASNAHHSMEPRSTLSYWENGKCFVYGSTQSQTFIMPMLAGYLGIDVADIVYISEYCGGGFGSKGVAYPSMAVPAHMSKKIGRPVMLRITRAEEYFIGSNRGGFQGRIKIGFGKGGKVSAVDLYVVQSCGPNGGFPDFDSAGHAVSLCYQPAAMRYRAVPVLTNTPPGGAQRGPGQNQIAMVMEPLLDRAARDLGVDRLAIRRLNSPKNDSLFGGEQHGVTSAYQDEGLGKGAERFGWADKLRRSGERNGSKVIGIGVGQAYHEAGAAGFDGLVRIAPDGRLHIHTGIGNLGTYSYAATSRVVAEVLQCDWERCVIERGDSRKHLPWNFGQFGSNTSFTMSRSNHAAAVDARNKLLEIAADMLGGSPEDFELGDETVFAKAEPRRNVSFAAAARRAVELGGRYDGHELPEDLNPITRASAVALAGTGLVGVAKDNYPISATPVALAAGFIMIELDLETGVYEILEYNGAIDCGTVIHPLSLANQVKGGAVMGIGLGGLERLVYDPQNGLPANVGLYQSKPPSYLDVPSHMGWDAVGIADPQNPVGVRGMGEPVMGCAASALICAISDALGGHYFNRTPITCEMIVNAASGRPQPHRPLQVFTF